MKKVIVDKSLCIGCGNCWVSCPNCFEMGKDGKSQVTKDCKENCCDLSEVADNCPVQAIGIEK